MKHESRVTALRAWTRRTIVENATRSSMNSKHNSMTSDQKLALRMMSDRNIGAMVTRFGWTWPETVRNNEGAAGEVIRILEAR